MHELLNTLSTNEYARFQSHQRSSFSSSVIEQYIAACIEYRYHPNGHVRQSNSSSSSRNANSVVEPNPNRPQPPLLESSTILLTQATRLEDYVSTPSHASDIGMIVATAAKIYAQRLIAEAVQLQKKDRQRTLHQPRNTTTTTTPPEDPTAMVISPIHHPNDTTNSTTTNRNPNNQNSSDSIDSNVLLCTYVYQAVQDRQLRQVDPGFFITSHDSNVPMTTTTSHVLYDQRRLATMAAIETYNNKQQQQGNGVTPEEHQ